MSRVMNDDITIRPSWTVVVAYVVGNLVQVAVVAVVPMLAVAGTGAAWPVAFLFVAVACWLSVRSCRVMVVLGANVMVVRNPLRSYRMSRQDLQPGLDRGRVAKVPVLMVGYASKGRWRRLTGGLPLAGTGAYTSDRRNRNAKLINRWLAS